MNKQHHDAGGRSWLVHETIQFGWIAGYLYICFVAILCFKLASLRESGVHSWHWGFAIAKAAVLAKFIMVGRAMRIGGASIEGPLLWPIVRKSLLFVLLLIAMTLIEEALVALIRHRDPWQAMAEVGGGTIAQAGATGFLMLLVLIPFFAFEAVANALGEDRLVRLFLGEKR